MQNLELANILDQLKQFGYSLSEVATQIGVQKSVLSEARLGKRKGDSYLPRLRALLQEKQIDAQTPHKPSFIQMEVDIRQFETKQKRYQRVLAWAKKYSGLGSAQFLGDGFIIALAFQKKAAQEYVHDLAMAQYYQKRQVPTKYIQQPAQPKYLPQHAASRAQTYRNMDPPQPVYSLRLTGAGCNNGGMGTAR